MKRDIERIRRNLCTLVRVLLELAAQQEEETEYKGYIEVQARWDDSGRKLQVSGSERLTRNTHVGKRTAIEEKGTKKAYLVALIKKNGASLELSDKTRASRSIEEREEEEIQYILDYMRNVDSKGNPFYADVDEMFKVDERLKNRGYWKFDINLKHQSYTNEENIQYLEFLISKINKPRGIERIIQNTGYPQERLNVFSQDSTSSLLNLDEQRRVRIQANQYKQALFKHLVTLNFSAQKKRLEMFRKYSVGAFLIHGESAAYGQEVLARYFLIQELNLTDKPPIYIDMRQGSMGYRTNSILKRLSDYLVQKYTFITDGEVEKIVKNICEIWTRQDVLIIFDYVDQMHPDIRKELMNKFWREIINKVHKLQKNIQSNNRIILLLVDYSQSNHQETVLSISEIQENAFCDAVVLPKNKSLSQPEDKEVLEKWLKQSIYKKAIIPEGLTTNKLLQDSANGVPKAIYSIICEHCCYDGEEFLDWARTWI